MLNVKVANLSGVFLDYATALAECYVLEINSKGYMTHASGKDCYLTESLDYHKNWNLSGVIMERESIFPTRMNFEDEKKYLAQTSEKRTVKLNDLNFVPFGNTPIEAVLRCYVGHKLGSEIDIPEEIINQLAFT